jgi:hypothetical protein
MNIDLRDSTIPADRVLTLLGHLPGANVANPCMQVVVPTLSRNRVRNRLALLMGAGHRQRIGRKGERLSGKPRQARLRTIFWCGRFGARFRTLPGVSSEAV